jgi:carbon starvation protein
VFHIVIGRGPLRRETVYLTKRTKGALDCPQSQTHLCGLTDSLPANLIATALCVAAWGYFLYQGVVDPLGGINTLWPLFGISNQMLAGIALMLGTVVLFKMKRDRFAWVTAAPTLWLLICTITAGMQKIFSADAKVSFVAHASKLSAALADGQIPAPAKTVDEVHRLIFNDYVNATLSGVFIFVVVAVVVYGLVAIARARGISRPTVKETPFEPMPVGGVVTSRVH